MPPRNMTIIICGVRMAAGTWKRLLFAATGAMMSPTTNQQGESIPAICHAVALENERLTIKSQALK